MSDYVFDGKKWKSCCKSLADIAIPDKAKLVYLRANVPQYLQIPNRGMLQVPAHCIILNLPVDVADDFIAQGIMVEAEESDFATMRGLLL
jgi:hypothetical protein